MWNLIKLLIITIIFTGCNGSSSIQIKLVDAPEITGLEGSSTGGNVSLSWTSGGGTTTQYQITYQKGLIAPSSCRDGVIIDETNIAKKFKGLSLATNYTFRVCSLNRKAKGSSGLEVTIKTKQFGNMNLVASQTGITTTDLLGQQVVYLGDINDDGVNDYAASIGKSGGGVKSVKYYSGKDHSSLYSFSGDYPTTSKVLDFNNDGIKDTVIGYKDHYNTITGNGLVGRIDVVSGDNQSVIYTYENAPACDFLGTSVASLGDINGDGFDDVIASAPGVDAGAKLYVFSGKDQSIIAEQSGGSDKFGKNIQNIGDINNDGSNDYITGDTFAVSGTMTGQIYLYSGKDHSTLKVFDAEQADITGFGNVFSRVGDVNQDGYDDVLFSAKGFDGTGTNLGKIYLYSGKDFSLLFSKTGSNDEDKFGLSLAGVGDFNNDGVPDFAVGTSQFDGAAGIDSGKVEIYSGKDYSIIAKVEGENAGDNFGYSISGIVNSTNFIKNQIIVAAPNVNGNFGKISIYTQD